MPSGGIRNHSTSNRGTADRRLRPRGRCELLLYIDFGLGGYSLDYNMVALPRLFHGAFVVLEQRTVPALHICGAGTADCTGTTYL